MRKQGKKYVEAVKKVDKEKKYLLPEAIKLVKDTSITKFDGSVDLAFNLNIDAKKSDEQLRGSIVFPNDIGKTKKVLAVVDEANIEKAKEAGADFVGGVELLEKIKTESWFDFDIIVTTPSLMPELGKYGTILGPKGLMPNPKTGTISPTPEVVIKDIKKGMITFKNDPQGNVHLVVGKTSLDDKKLLENITEAYQLITRMKPEKLKGIYIKNMTISSTMGPGVKIDLSSFDKQK